MKKTFIICLLLTTSFFSTAQTLQQVTDLGNITTNTISIRNAQGLNIGVDAASGYTINSHLLKPSPVESRTIRFDCSTIVADGGWEFYNSNLNKSLLYVKQSGNIGIGTNNPSAKLEVAGSICVYDGNFYKIRSSNSTNWSNTDIMGHGWSGQQDYTSILVAGNTTNSAEIRLMADGNVGIGTTNPQSRLAVNGTVTAVRVKVTQAGWPDFVFEPAYNLPSLSEVEAFIKRNKHLADIPSVDEVKANGLDVGDVQAKLLQKIEELTLYLIDMNKKVDAQQQIISTQQQLIEEQNKKFELIKKQNNCNMHEHTCPAMSGM